MSAGFCGETEVPQQRHVHPPPANTRQELPELLPARSARCPARLETPAFLSSLGKNLSSLPRSISSSPPEQLWLFLWKILAGSQASHPHFQFYSTISQISVCSGRTEAAVGPWRAVPATHNSWREYPFPFLRRTAGPSCSQPTLRDSLLPMSCNSTRTALGNRRSLIQNLMKFKGEKKIHFNNS